MLSNITNPTYLPRYVHDAFTFPATGNVERYTIVTRNGTPVADGSINTFVDGIAGTQVPGDDADHFTLVTDEIAIVKVEAGETIAYNDAVAAANTGTGRARAGTIGTDRIIGKSLDVSDGSGTAEKPHYVRVHLYL